MSEPCYQDTGVQGIMTFGLDWELTSIYDIQLFWHGLFNIPTQSDHSPTSPPMCKTQPSRKECLDLLLRIGSGSDRLFSELCDLILLEHNTMGMHAPLGQRM